MNSDIGKEWLETVLKKKHFDESPATIENFLLQSGVIPDGQNSLSKIQRITANVVLGSGKRKKVQLIVKNQHTTKQMKKLSINCGLFLREITVYRDILPKMENLLEEIGDTDENPWGQCVDIRLYDRIVLEDLSRSGYEVIDWKTQHGLILALMVMKQLGKIHALSRVLLERSEIPMEIFRENIWERLDAMNSPYEEKVGWYDEILEQWGEKWQEARKRLKKARPDFGERYVKAMRFEPSEFTVLSLGDCQSNNLLFKNAEGVPERPVSMKFIDFQLCFVHTPAFDLFYYMLTTVKNEVRVEYFDKLIQTYSDSLGFYLKKCNYSGFIPTVDDVHEMLNKRMILALGLALWTVPIHLSDLEDAPEAEDGDDMESDENEEHDHRFVENLSETVRKIIESTLDKSMQLGVI